DTIFQELMKNRKLNLHRIVLYTTRPIRAGETEGVDYHFVSDEELEAFQAAGKVIELRCYNTVNGVWKYFTVDDDHMDLSKNNYLAIGTLVSYEKMKAYFGLEAVKTVYVEVADDIRLIRAIERERKQAIPAYQEMCRRFLADSEDFSEKNLKEAGISRRFQNNGEIKVCLQEITKYIAESTFLQTFQ
ncbi:MAG: guanylate kinase, partial [Oscillospiraceae bacterium]|nr:guanylate kinase [Oscillospiraceae bacterium]